MLLAATCRSVGKFHVMATVLRQIVSPGRSSSCGMLMAQIHHDVFRSQLESVMSLPESSMLVAEKRMQNLCSFYKTLVPTDRAAFLKVLATEYGVEQTAVLQLAQNIISLQERSAGTLLKAEERLRHSLIPRYQHLFTQISHLEQPAGVKFLTDMRADILVALAIAGVENDNPHLQAMNNCLRDLLALWFSVGFFHLERITWESPCDMLQKISEYEAVHPIRNWTDLKRRVGPYRRCFVFTHNSMPKEPVVVLHTALTSEISSSIQSIVQHTPIVSTSDDESSNSSTSTTIEELENPSNITTAIFYSITSTQKGLQGVEIGNYLIKSAVRELTSEFPNMHQYSSLSPIPGFREWLLNHLTRLLHQMSICEEDEKENFFMPNELSEIRKVFSSTDKIMYEHLKAALNTNSWMGNEELKSVLKNPLLRLCARYLYLEKRRRYAYNPVANFHLRNGAVMWRLNWMADTSPRGLSASCSMMVNYRYFLDQTEQNSKSYIERQQITASDQIIQLVQRTVWQASKHM